MEQDKARQALLDVALQQLRAQLEPAKAGAAASSGTVAESRAQQNTASENPSQAARTQHLDGVLSILNTLNVDLATQLAAVFFLAGNAQSTLMVHESQADDEVRGLVNNLRRLEKLGQTLLPQSNSENLRKMMLAMASDLRVVLIRLALQLQSLRYFADNKHLEVPNNFLLETAAVWAPLANRLGIWQLKWEIEDLVFRFQEPLEYKKLAKAVEEKRAEREQFVDNTIGEMKRLLEPHRIDATVSGRPKHLFSIAQKMRNKAKSINDLYDLRAFRIICNDLSTCYQILSIFQENWRSVPNEFDDYIARPKANGYQSLHTVLVDDMGRQFEVQIRTHAMHQFAEHGVAAHWRYKEASNHDITAPRSEMSFLRALLAWQSEIDGSAKVSSSTDDGELQSQELNSRELENRAQLFALEDQRIYVLTPQAKIVDLPRGATAVDFAYHVHTDLGHRCRGARVDGQLLALNQPLMTGQTVEIIVARDSERTGPSRDWLNSELGFVRSQRGRLKLRHWFNARELERDLAAGRAVIEKLMQREGKTHLPLDELAKRLGLSDANALFLAIQKELLGQRVVEQALRGEVLGGESEKDQARELEQAVKSGDTVVLGNVKHGENAHKTKAPILVLGADFLLTQLAGCCRPLPPDTIVGYVTRGRGVSVHRSACGAFARLRQRDPDRALDCEWGIGNHHRLYPLECSVICEDRAGILRDVSDVFARNKLRILSVRTLSQRDRASFRIMLEVPDLESFMRAKSQLSQVKGVLGANRC